MCSAGEPPPAGLATEEESRLDRDEMAAGETEDR